MTVTKSLSLTLEQFLKLPETKPPSEYINGEIIQKPMPKTRHSRLQSKIINTVNQITEANKIAYAFPELRCTFAGRSIIPDIAIIRWENIAFDDNGEPVDDVVIAPDWTIEILSPEQSSNRVTGNILHCIKYGCQLGWLIDPDDRSILMFQPQKEPELKYAKDDLIILTGVELNLTVEEVFGWLKMSE
ncbi:MULTISPECIES: Uma2 family endonuclease [Sphaerospermopsis]|uniref:Uma2 family endonuclease n=1 Tax=Sphaerospermopsis aphanizomenoides LEGE 00250 TaxID=2777972 RepID=A0ABR9VAJ3_9CYAN|nr:MULTISPECIES: Uma2 family endonuclease [Sphaerospermopsis]MBD2144432.1 Uma2 family endonuclease [Sphaerospermopsis sp. FACHB-1194]MBE9235491.1 Uma2 family endonuclease [Sphaerospermopsis aphanizomenoides LEGE 00250]